MFCFRWCGMGKHRCPWAGKAGKEFWETCTRLGDIPVGRNEGMRVLDNIEGCKQMGPCEVFIPA